MKKDRLIGLVSLVLGGIFLALTLQIPMLANSSSATEPGPRLFPMIACILLIICGLGLIFQKQAESETFLTKEQAKRLFILLGAFILYCVGLYFVGFVIMTPILLFVTMSMFAGEKNLSLIVKLVYSVGLTALIYLVFVVFLKTNVPMGLLFK